MASHTGSTMKWLTFKVLLTSHKGDSCYFLLTFLVFVFLQDCPRVEIPNLELSCIFSVIQFWYSNALQVQLNKHIKFHAYKWSNQHNWLNLFRMRSIIGAGWCQMTGLSTYDNFLDWTESLPHRFHFEHSTSICFQPGPRWQPVVHTCIVTTGYHWLQGHKLHKLNQTVLTFVLLSQASFYHECCGRVALDLALTTSKAELYRALQSFAAWPWSLLTGLCSHKARLCEAVKRHFFSES